MLVPSRYIEQKLMKDELDLKTDFFSIVNKSLLAAAAAS
jgi:hypothetical protein